MKVKEFQKEEEFPAYLALWCCQYLVKLGYLTVQSQVVFAAPLAEWCNLSGLCQGHNSEAEDMLRNQGLNQLEGLGTYEIKNTKMNPNYPERKQGTHQPTSTLPSKGRPHVHSPIYIYPPTSESALC